MKTIIVFAIVMTMCNTVKAADKCADPGLRPELQKACYEMEKVCAEVGCAVSIR